MIPSSESLSMSERVTEAGVLGRWRAALFGLRFACLVLTTMSSALAVAGPETPAQPEQPLAIEGEIVQLAIDQCQRGDAAQALATFNAVKQQLDLSPALLSLIQKYEGTGCPLPVTPPSVRWGLQLGGGYDNNVNQGIVARSLVLGSGPGSIDLELSDIFKPQASNFVVAGVAVDVDLSKFFDRVNHDLLMSPEFKSEVRHSPI